MAPGFRSRLGQPSRRLPMPGANESSTVEWQSAQVTPTRVSVSLPSIVSTLPCTADHSVQLQQGDGRRGARQIDAAVLYSLDYRRRQRLRIDLQADRQRRRGVDRLRDHFVHAQRVAPLRFVAEGIEAKDLLALRDQCSLVGRARRLLRASTTGRQQHGHPALQRRIPTAGARCGATGGCDADDLLTSGRSHMCSSVQKDVFTDLSF